MSDLPSDWLVRCRSGVECSHPLGIACRISVLREPGGEPFAEKLALSSCAPSLAQQRGALAQGEPNVRRSARIACVARAERVKGEAMVRVFFARWPGRSKLWSRIVHSQVGHFWRAQLGQILRALKIHREPRAKGICVSRKRIEV